MAYSKFYAECSSQADKYSTFQMRWVTNVFTLFDLPDVASCPLEESIISAIHHCLASAVWRYCADIVRKYLLDAAVCSAGEVLPGQSEKKHYCDIGLILFVSKYWMQLCVVQGKFLPGQLEKKHYWKFFGWAVCSSIMNCSAQSGRNEEELALLKCIRLPWLQDKAEKEEFAIPVSLIMRDEGWMSFLRPEHLPFARNALDKIRSVVNHKPFETYGKDFVNVASQMIQCDKTLHKPLLASVQEPMPNQFPQSTVEGVASRPTSKVMNAMLGEVIESAEQMQLLSAGSTTSALNLRDKLHPDNA